MKTKTKTGPAPSLLTGSEMLMHALVNEQVTVMFGYPGGAIMPVYDALYHYKKEIHHILVRHEQGAVHAAEGYARICGKTGVVLATSGPGATNLITGLADALIDSTPIVCITGQVFANLLGTDAFQEIDVINTTTPVTKWNVQISEAKDIASTMARAFYIARSGRPGPVVVDITKNAQTEKIPYEPYKKCEHIKTYYPNPKPSSAQIKEAASIINAAKRPLLLAGQGILISGAEPELLAFSEKTGIPVACTLLGLSAFPASHELYVGLLGMHGNYAPNINTNQCDVLLAIGMRFDDRVTGRVDAYAKQAKIIHIDIDQAELNKIIQTDVPIHGDAKATLSALIEACSPASHPNWLENFRLLEKTEYDTVIHAELHPSGESITMAEVINNIRQFTKGDAVFISDVGQHQMITARYGKYLHTRSHITSGGLGTMGFALPAALGAAASDTKKPILAIIGDGGVQMTLEELGTIMQYQLPVKVVILNNSFLGMVRQWQQLFFEKRYSFTELVNPNFQKIAEAYTIPTAKIDQRVSLREGIEKMLITPGPYLLEVVVGKEENIFPMIPSGASVSDIMLRLPA